MAEELKKEDVQKDLEKFVGKSRAEHEKAKEATMTPEERKKAEDEKKAAEKKRQAAEAQAKKDAELIAKKDEELSDDEKKQKSELIQKQKDDAESKLTPNEKIEHIKKETQKRIDEIKNELLQVKDKSSKEADELRQKLQDAEDKNKALEDRLSKPKEEANTIEARLAKEEQSLIDKHIQEDKDKPRDQRREMTNEELDEWFAEEPTKAQVWITQREMRRVAQKSQIYNGLKVQEIQLEQSKNVDKVWKKHPELNTIKREAELVAEGKSKEDIHKILCDENQKYKLFYEELAKLQRTHAYANNLPELAMSAMEQRLNASPSVDEKQKQIDDLTKKVEELTANIQQLQTQDTGINSNRKSPPKEGEFSDKEKQFIKTAKETGLSQEQIDARIKKMRQS